MKPLHNGLFTLALIAIVVSGCFPSYLSTKFKTLPDARQQFETVLKPQRDEIVFVERAPKHIFQTIKYSAPSGKLSAYLSPDPKDGQKHPAIIWITGGDCNSIGDVWSPASPDNDQTAAAFRNAGIIMMFPSLRGGNSNPGRKEGFLGEVDDVLAAFEHLKQQPYVDPNRIFLGGHSTGGTLALLVAESSSGFRGIFSFGPIDVVSYYGADSGLLPFNIYDPHEVEVRSPIYWLSSIQSPTWVFEGTEGNIEALQAMAEVSTNSNVRFIELAQMDHFNILAPINEIIASKILEDIDVVSNFSLSSVRWNAAVRK